MKKVLLIDERLQGSNFGIDLCYPGLIDLVGWQNVRDFPPLDRRRPPFPVWDDADPAGSYQRERFSLNFHPDGHRVPRLTALEARDFKPDVVLLTERAEAWDIFKSLNLQQAEVRVLALHDEFQSSMQTLRGRYGADVKVFSSHPVNGTVPLNYALNERLFPGCLEQRADLTSSKLHDVCLLGGSPGLGSRQKIVERLKKRFPRDPIFLDGRLPRAEFMRTMSQSRVVIVPNGDHRAGTSLREFEAPFAGSLMLRQRNEAQTPHPFLDGVHCLDFSTAIEMEDRIDWLLSHPLEREAVASAGLVRCLQHHTAEARARQVLDLDGQVQD